MMKTVFYILPLLILSVSAGPLHCQTTEPSALIERNPRIDMEGYLNVAREAATYRESRRLTESQFLTMMNEPNIVILDARSQRLFDILHIRGAINLSFPDISIAELERVLPNKNQKILIYCNNNFSNDEFAFPSKMANASLNISTFISLYSYGYRNVYELGPLLDVNQTRIPLVSTAGR